MQAVMVGILYYPPERDPRHPDRSWLTPEQPIFAVTNKPIETLADVRPALRGLGYVPDDIDYDLELLLNYQETETWTKETDAAMYNIVSYMRPTREVVPSFPHLHGHPRTITVRLKCAVTHK